MVPVTARQSPAIRAIFNCTDLIEENEKMRIKIPPMLAGEPELQFDCTSRHAMHFKLALADDGS
jgi:hypothetical protein